MLIDGQRREGKLAEGECACSEKGPGLYPGERRKGGLPGSLLQFSAPAALSSLVLSLSQITLVPSCLLPARFQLNHSLKFGAVAKTLLPCNRIFTVSTAAATSLITCCCNLHC